MHAVLIAAAIGCVSLLYATAGQAGGTAFLAVMAFAAFPAAEMRGTALLLNIVAAGYATWQLHRRAANDATMLAPLIVPSLFTAFAGALIALNGPMYFMLTGLLLIAAGTLMVFRRTADTIEARPMQPIPAAAMGAAAGFISGLTGVGGGVFLAPILIALGWTSPKGAAAVSPPFFLCNSIAGFVGVLFAGQSTAPGAFIYVVGQSAAPRSAHKSRDAGCQSEPPGMFSLPFMFAGARLLFAKGAGQDLGYRRPPSPQGDDCPDRFDDAEWPGTLQKAVCRAKRAGRRKTQDEFHGCASQTRSRPASR